MTRTNGLAAMAALTWGLASAGCGGSSTSGTAGMATASKPVAVGTSAVQPAPKGTKAKVTLVSYQAQVKESSGDILAPGVFGVNLKIANVGGKTLSAKSPNYYSVLHLSNTTGALTVAHASGPCGGAFYRAPIHLAPGRSTRGCIPYRYSPGKSRPVNFGFGFGLHTKLWPIHSQ